MKAFVRKYLWVLIVAAAAAVIFGQSILGLFNKPATESLSALQKQNAQSLVVRADLNTADHVVKATLKGGKTYEVEYAGSYESELVKQFRAKHVDYKVSHGGYNWNWLLGFLPLILIFGAMLYLLNKGPGMGMLPKANTTTAERPTVRFKDVIGADEAIADLQSVVEALQDPDNYDGPAIHQGILLEGETGVGKTLLAKAVAGEAGVPFYYLSGPALTSMFINHSARLIAEFFESVKKQLRESGGKAAIIFVDEADALAHKRSTHDNTFGGQQERNTTTDALLHELGVLFEYNPFVVVIAATNHKQLIDEAVLRPGRLGKHIPMTKPDVLARQRLFELYTDGATLDEDVSLKSLAQLTSDMTGAQIEEVIKEAQRLTYRDKSKEDKTLTMDTLRTAVIRVAMGVPRDSAAVHEEDALIAAIHESGHTLAALHMGRFTLQHVTIVPIGQSGGSTWFTRDDRQLVTRPILVEELTVLMGGLAAEQYFNPHRGASAGVSHDLEIATAMAIQAVCTTHIGNILMTIDPEKWERHPQQALVGNAVQLLLDEALSRAQQLVSDNIVFIETLRDRLLADKTLSREQVIELQGTVAVEAA